MPEGVAVSGKAWRIVAAVCVQHMPTLGREKTDLELRYLQMKDQCRVEKSKLSDHELEEIAFERLKKARVLKAQEEEINEPTNAGGDEESNAFEDLQESKEIELQEFEPASRETEADRQGDIRSLERRLDRWVI